MTRLPRWCFGGAGAFLLHACGDGGPPPTCEQGVARGQEVCDREDNDCDDAIDEDARDAVPWYADADGDGAGDLEQVMLSCAAPSGYVATGDDCDDGDPDVLPGTVEACDEVDQD